MKYLVSLLLIVQFCIFPIDGAAQTNDLNVAIFLYNDVELLDFSGPGEVFEATEGFNVFTVAVSSEPVVSQGFVEVSPEYTIFDCPNPEIVVLPGGSVGKVLGNEQLIHWVKETADKGGIMLSVCTGAYLLSRSGLLNGKKATTWYGSIDRLQELTPGAEILKNTRFVDNGQIITTAGVSAGIDGALHVVSKLKGMEAARKTAKYMEYDKWEPEAGLIIENEFITKMRKEEIDQALRIYEESKTPEDGIPVFYEGELINIGKEYLKRGQFEEAAKTLELNVEVYPNSKLTHLALAETYSNLNDPNSAAKYYQNYLRYDQSSLEVVDKLGLNESIQFFETLQNEKQLNERDINILGYRLLQAERTKEAIKVFKFNITAFPESWNVYDSLAEAYMIGGENEKAVKYYKKSLEINPDNENAKKKLTELRL